MLIRRLWQQQPGKYFCLSTKSASKDWRDHFFSRAEFSNINAFLEQHRNKDIYFCPHGFTRRRRKEEFAVMPTLLWSDMDEVDPRTCKVKPTIAIESSPGRYVGLWSIDRELTDKMINRALTYYLGGDHGGWDLTQVLRVPGTTNYKYQSTPRVRTLWTDGPVYTLRDIERKLPKVEKQQEENNGAALKLYNKYEKKLPQWLRRELLRGKPTTGKRSEMLWKLSNTLIECGLSSDECFTLLKASPWNKFKGRDEQLRHEIEKGKNRKFDQDEEDKGSDYQFLSRSLADVVQREFDWLWYPYLALGELSILEGDPGLGKSYLAQMVSGHIVDGHRLPSVKRLPVKQGKVAYFDIENTADTVTKKRVATNEFDNLDDYYQEEEPFSIDDEDQFEAVLGAIERLQPVLVVFDTLNTYIGKADTYKASETQQAFAKFRMIASRFNCAVLVLRHLTKNSKDKSAIMRGQGSVSFAGLARVVMAVGVMPDDADTRVMAIAKANGTPKVKSLTFTITELPDTMKERDRSQFEWGEFVDISADDISGSPDKKEGSSERDDAKEFLEAALAGGAVSVEQLKQAAEKKSVSWRTVQRAADALGITRRVKGFGENKTSMWSLDNAKH